jgi:hypothetical protein
MLENPTGFHYVLYNLNSLKIQEVGPLPKPSGEAEVEFKPVPILSYKSSSQPGRLGVVSGMSLSETRAPRASDDDLSKEIEGSIAQASIMWLLHGGLEVVQDRRVSLEQQIVQFSSTVFEALVTSYPKLRHVENERLWLIYFKGVLNANTHRREEMLSAFRNIYSKNTSEDLPPPPEGPREIEKHAVGRTSDVEVLEQIARSLALGNSSFEA